MNVSHKKSTNYPQIYPVLKGVFVVTILSTVIFVYYYSFRIKRNFLEINVLDIGQGDSILIKSPDQKYMLIDGGPDSKVLNELGKNMPFWKRDIDIVVLTHPDLDHVGGLPEVLERYNVGNIFSIEDYKGNSNFEAFIDIAESKDVEIKIPNEFDDFRFGCCVDIDFVWPEYRDDLNNLIEVGGPNNISSVFYLKYDRFDMYFGGDIEEPYESAIITKHPKDIDVLKVSHHGSQTSTSEASLNLLRPEIALISSGRNNRHGHPHQDIIEKLEDRGVDIYNTGEIGAIKLLSDGKSIWLE